MDSISYASDIYPNHDLLDREPDTYTGRKSLQDFNYLRMVQEGFGYITSHATDGLKRCDSMGRVVVITPCDTTAGAWRVWHYYRGHKVESHFDMSVAYAKDILSGRDNLWLFLSYPEEND